MLLFWKARPAFFEFLSRKLQFDIKAESNEKWKNCWKASELCKFMFVANFHLNDNFFVQLCSFLLSPQQLFHAPISRTSSKFLETVEGGTKRCYVMQLMWERSNKCLFMLASSRPFITKIALKCSPGSISLAIIFQSVFNRVLGELNENKTRSLFVVIIFFLLTLEFLTRIFFYVLVPLILARRANSLLEQAHRILLGKAKNQFSANIAGSDKSLTKQFNTIHSKHNSIVYRENRASTVSQEIPRHDELQ